MNARSKLLYAGLCAAGLALGAATGAQAGQSPSHGSDEGSSQASNQTKSDASKGVVPLPQEIRQRHEFGQTVTEYLRNGRVFMITVKPRVGPTQYWDDPDGDGQFQLRTGSGINENLNLPKWRIGSW